MIEMLRRLFIPVIIAALFILQTVGDVPVATAIQEPITIFTGFTQTLYNGGDQNPEHPTWNLVILPYSQMYCQEDNTIENICQSLYNDAGEFWIFYEDPTEGWTSYCSTRSTNELTHLYAYNTYWFNVENTCDLIIACP